MRNILNIKQSISILKIKLFNIAKKIKINKLICIFFIESKFLP